MKYLRFLLLKKESPPTGCFQQETLESSDRTKPVENTVHFNPLNLPTAFFKKKYPFPYTMAKKANLNSLKKVIVPILKRNGVVKAGIFGSVARGEATKKSDVDILIKFKGRKSIFDLAHLELELEKNLHRKVDV